MNVKYPHIYVRLTGRDGNAYAIMGRVAQALRQNKVPQEEIDEYFAQCKSGDYDNLLRVTMETVETD